MFVSLEGPDGVGKSTQARLLAARLRGEGREVVECREPGGTALGERVRALVLDHGDWIVAGRSEALLFATARAQLVAEVVGPALERGAWVVCDRFVDSSIAYQGGARGLGTEAVRQVNLFATDGLLPDRTLLLAGTARLGRRLDRIESAGEDFRGRVAAAFAALARAEPGRIVTIDAGGSVDEVAARIWAALGDALP